MFLNLLVPRGQPRLHDPAHFQVDDVFSVPGVGNVVSGTCLSGVIRVSDTLLLGPDPTGQFLPVQIRSIQRKRLPVVYVRGGQCASFALKKLRRNQLRTLSFIRMTSPYPQPGDAPGGMQLCFSDTSRYPGQGKARDALHILGIVLVAEEVKPRACLDFVAETLILHHPSTISVGYQAMVHAGPVRQTASIVSFHKMDRLRTGDRDLVRFRFIKYPEYLYPGLRLIFREGKTKAVGTITEVHPLADTANSANPRVRRGKRTPRSAVSATTPTTSSSTTSPPSSTNPPHEIPSSVAVPSQPLSPGGQPVPGSSLSQLESVGEFSSPAYSKQRKHYRQRKSDPNADEDI